MISINNAKRLIKRILLANLIIENKELFLTPLVCGNHGIGKTQMIKQLANDLNAICITIEGGTLKEGEITGIPYQTKDDNGRTIFRFLPYYAVERIQKEEERLYKLLSNECIYEDYLNGTENKYSYNNLDYHKKIELLQKGIVKPVIIFIDEVNRTDSLVYKELMNILLTKSVNGYKFPWWVFFVCAMNPTTLSSQYATNEMDPAQLDRFIKLNVGFNKNDWLIYAKNNNFPVEMMKFVDLHPKYLADNNNFNDSETPSPSPRGWEMIKILFESIPLVRGFFNSDENLKKIEEADMKQLMSFKLGSEVSLMYDMFLNDKVNPITPKEILEDDIQLKKVKKRLKEISHAKIIQSIDLLISFFEENKDDIFMNCSNTDLLKIKEFVSVLDSSNRLLLAQQLINIICSNGDYLFIKLADIFEYELLETLNLSDELIKRIKRGK